MPNYHHRNRHVNIGRTGTSSGKQSSAKRSMRAVNPQEQFDSNGPNGKIRGTAKQIFNKYTAIAREIKLGGDRVLAESFLQWAEHYAKIITDYTLTHSPVEKEKDDNTSTKTKTPGVRSKEKCLDNNKDSKQKDLKKSGDKKSPVNKKYKRYANPKAKIPVKSSTASATALEEVDRKAVKEADDPCSEER